jgi:hypothetical protein
MSDFKNCSFFFFFFYTKKKNKKNLKKKKKKKKKKKNSSLTQMSYYKAGGGGGKGKGKGGKLGGDGGGGDGGGGGNLGGGSGGGARPIDTLARGLSKNDPQLILGSLRELVATLADEDQLSLAEREAELTLDEPVASELVLALELHAVRSADVETATITSAMYLLTRLRENRFTLMREDVAAVVGNAIVSCASNPIVAENGCGVLRNVACSDELLDALCQSHVLTPLLDSLTRHRESARVVLTGTAALSNMSRHVGLRENAVDAGAANTLLSLAKQYAADEATLAMILRALGNLGACFEARPQFERLGGVAVCIGALQRGGSISNELAESVCQCLSNYMGDEMVVKRMSADPGLVKLIASLVIANKAGARSSERRVLGAAMCLMRNLAVYDPIGDVKRRIRETRMLEAVVGIMRKHHANLLIQAQGLVLVKHMLAGAGLDNEDRRSNHSEITGDYGIPVIFSALLTFPVDESIQLHGLECLEALCSGSDKETLEIAKSGGRDICNAALRFVDEATQMGTISDTGIERIPPLATSLESHLRHAIENTVKTHE